MGSTKGFRVDPEELTKLAQDIHELFRDVSGDSGAVSGNLPQFQEKASEAALRQGLAGFWKGGQDVFSDAYGHEHDGICRTYSNIMANLQQLEQACRATAESYRKADGNSRSAVNGAGVPW